MDEQHSLTEHPTTRNGSIQRLNDLVLSLILEDLLKIDRSTLLSAASTCGQLYVLAVPLIYRRINLYEKMRGCDYLLRRLTKSDSRIPTLVREIVVEQGSWLDEGAQSLLLEVISNSKRLETLRWHGSYEVLQRILESLQGLYLRESLTIDAQMSPSYTSKVPGLLGDGSGLSSPWLRSLDCHIPQPPGAERSAKLCLFKTLKSCPNLRRLTLAKDVGGCIIYHRVPAGRVELDVRPGDQLPQLEELSFPSHTSDTLFSMADLVKWGDVGGWTRLKSLKINDMRSLGAFTARVPALRSLHVNVSWDIFVMYKQNFYGMGPIEELNFRGDGMQLPLDILDSYSATLKSLSIHAPEPYLPETRPDVPLTDLQWLRRTCLKLESLSIDLNRDGQWPYPYLLELAKFPNVAHITLFAEGRRGGDSPVLPLIDKVSSQLVFEFLCSHKAGRPLLSLAIERGGTGPWTGGYPARHLMQEWGYRARFECRLEEPGGSISVVQIGGERVPDLTAEVLSQMFLPGDGVFARYDAREMGILARLLSREWAGERLISTGLLEGLEGREEELREFGDSTGRLLTAFKQVSDEERVEYQRQLEKELMRRRRQRLMEEAFPDDCSLYDVLRGKK